MTATVRLRRTLAGLRLDAGYVRSRRRLDHRLRGCPGDVAAVAHVWYADEWLQMRDRVLGAVEGGPVVLTVPDGAPLTDAQRRALEHDGLVVEVPNRGRDVVPFLHVAPSLRRAGVRAVLKVHTKRSEHSTIGASWLATTLEELLGPRRAEAVEVVRGGRADVVGPRSHYYPLTVALEGNRPLVERYVRRAVGPEAGRVLARPAEHGFFAGTMMWLSVDEALAVPRPRGQELRREQGLIDGTPAHALERVLGLRAQLAGRAWSMTVSSLGPQPARSTTEPEWFRPERRPGLG
ncbi:hypothetical protein JQN72_08650 [Phycicoccus sp. CSK15P-2]|uniref:rhamnan synthesis F family protein n=1 Tax=Phycicoccus sp. CSK15P-2 TaxID=2807627 RepID=UPI00194DD5CA|nr:rhamnan synthesis F family protein [Phycicoccus sp. CSK15P-2]MBM6404307.1 hypothetical protein [Phycicoccus sp. CSK15P-2]